MLKKLLLLCALLALAHPAFAEPEKFDFDKSHTHILFFINHAGFSQMVGLVREYDGQVMLDEKSPEKSSVVITMKPASIDTNHAGLNAHLQKAEFFNSAKFPEIRFESTAVQVLDKNHAKVSGNLTLLGVTKPLVLDVTLNKLANHPVTANYTAGFTATGSLLRSDFGMGYGLPDLIGDEVAIRIETEVYSGLHNLHEKQPIKH